MGVPRVTNCTFYDTIKKPNVNLVKGALDSFERDAVVLAHGSRIECDVVILATGYNMFRGAQFDVTGRGGKTLREIFTALFTYWGMLVPGLSTSCCQPVPTAIWSPTTPFSARSTSTVSSRCCK